MQRRHAVLIALNYVPLVLSINRETSLFRNCYQRKMSLSSLKNQTKIDDFHIFINISAGIYSSVLSCIPFERGIN